jgi:hypothetical protein
MVTLFLSCSAFVQAENLLRNESFERLQNNAPRAGQHKHGADKRILPSMMPAGLEKQLKSARPMAPMPHGRKQ